MSTSHPALAGTADLSGIGVTIKVEAESKGSRFRNYLASAQKKFSKAKKLLLDVENVAAPWDTSNSIVDDILAPLRDIVSILDTVGDLHPWLQVVVGIAKIVIQAELNRKDNDDRIALVFHGLGSLFFMMSEIDPSFDEGRPSEEIKSRLEQVRTSIEAFGNFCEVYYKRPELIKLLCAGRYKEKLVAYAEDFATHKQELQLLLAVQTSSMAKTLTADVKTIISLLNTPSEKEQSAQRLVDSMGGLDYLIEHRGYLQDIAKRLGLPPASNATIQSLQVDLDELLQHNLESFLDKIELTLSKMQATLKSSHQSLGEKMDFSTASITNQVERSTSFVMDKLDDGPHRRINDPDIQVVWKEMHAGSSVETRLFLEALFNHFESAFTEYLERTETEHPDAWTLYFLSKRYYLPSEKAWTRTAADSYRLWSWAVGPYKTDLEYLHKIRHLIARLARAPEQVLPRNRKRVAHLASAVPFLKLIEVYDDVLHTLGEVEEDPAYEALEKLRVPWRDLASEHIRANLDRLKYRLNDPGSVALVLDGGRLENHIMALVCTLLRHDMDIVKYAVKEPVALREFTDMRETWQSVFDAFGRRLGVLQEVWRQPRLDLDSQVQYYRRGIFYAWHERSRAKARAASIDPAQIASDSLGASLTTDDATSDALAVERAKNLLRYALPSGPEDESGLIDDMQPDWELIAVSERKEAAAFQRRIEGIVREGQRADIKASAILQQVLATRSSLDRLLRLVSGAGNSTEDDDLFDMTDDPRSMFVGIVPDGSKVTSALELANQALKENVERSAAGKRIFAVYRLIIKDLRDLLPYNTEVEIFIKLFVSVGREEIDRPGFKSLEVAICYLCMFDAVYQLYLFPPLSNEQKNRVNVQLVTLLQELGDTINSFGSASDTFYRIVARSGASEAAARSFVSDRLSLYVNQFANHKGRLRALLAPEAWDGGLPFKLDVEEIMHFFA